MEPTLLGPNWLERASRARLLSERYPASGEVLSFVAEIVSLQDQVAMQARNLESLLAFRSPLCGLVALRGPQTLREAASDFDEVTCRRALADYWKQVNITSPQSFFARVLLQPLAAAGAMLLWGPDPETGPAKKTDDHCPGCGHPPQVGALRPQGEGKSLFLVCSLCLQEWPFRRGCCPSCGEASEGNLSYFSAPGFEHFQMQACDSCHTYLHTIDLSRDPAAIPDVDELAALPLDLWARDQGYQKRHPNFAGI